MNLAHFSFKWISKLSLPSKIEPRCFWDDVRCTDKSLNLINKCDALTNFQEKNDLLSLFRLVWIEWRFLFECPCSYLANIYIINRWEKWCVICQKFYFKSNPIEVNDVYQEKPGFLIRHCLVGDILTRMAKNCMKITKSTFWRQNSRGRHGGPSKFFGYWDVPHPVPPLGENLKAGSRVEP